MRSSETEIRLRRLLAAVPQQTNKCKLVHHVATLRNLVATLKNETAESISSNFSESKADFYSTCIEEVAYTLDVIEMDDVWESLTSVKGQKLCFSSSVSDGAQELSDGPSTSDLPLFPSCLKRKYSADEGLLEGPRLEETEVEGSQSLVADILGKKTCLDLNEYGANISEEPMQLENEIERLGNIRHESGREGVADTAGDPEHVDYELERVGKTRQETTDAAETSAESEHLEHKDENVRKVNFKGDIEGDEVEHLDDDSRLYITQHQTEQEKIVNEMLLLTKQIKESSLLLGNSLHDTEELLKSSDLTIRHCLSATTSAHMKTGDLLNRTHERECGCITWLSFFIVYFAFLYMVIFIRVT